MADRTGDDLDGATRMSWEYLRGHKLAITVFEGCDHFLDASCEAWRFFADDPNRIASITQRNWATVSN
jgi:hypothetical protein